VPQMAQAWGRGWSRVPSDGTGGKATFPSPAKRTGGLNIEGVRVVSNRLRLSMGLAIYGVMRVAGVEAVRAHVAKGPAMLAECHGRCRREARS